MDPLDKLERLPKSANFFHRPNGGILSCFSRADDVSYLNCVNDCLLHLHIESNRQNEIEHILLFIKPDQELADRYLEVRLRIGLI